MSVTNEIVPLIADGKTCVFWDVEDYPIHDCVDLASLYRNMEEAIKKRGCHGEVSIQAYVEKSSDEELRRKYEDAGFIIDFVPEGGKEGRIDTMHLGIVLWLIDNHKSSTKTNVIVLAKNIGDDMAGCLMRFYRDEHRVLLSQAEPEWGFPGASSMWFLTSLFDGSSGTSQRLDNKKQKISCS